MKNVTLHDIEDIARLESAKMQHFYVGVEHLFIALTKLDGGLTTGILENCGQSGRYLRYATRDAAGRGDDRRYWPGYRRTPRAAVVMEQAETLINQGVKPDERALFMAILQEGDSLPIRIMQESGVEISNLYDVVSEWSGKGRALAPLVPIDGGEQLSDDERAVLQQMFQKYIVIEIQHIFSEGLSFSGATVMLVRPIQADGRSDAPVVVKIAERHAILSEKKRYDSFVRDTLPPTTARVDSDPALPDKSPLGGLKYTFVRLRGEDLPINLHEFTANRSSDDVANFLRESLYDGFRESWWGQARPYRFAAWQEYEFLLPAALIIQAEPEDIDATRAITGRLLRPLEEWSRNSSVHATEVVELENFTIQKIKLAAGSVQMSAGSAAESINRASQVEVRGLQLATNSHYRGEVMHKVLGRVIQTRDDLLQEQIVALEPTFNIMDDALPYQNGYNERLPNPMRRYQRILDMRISGTLSTIHGDLHMGNVLIGPGGDAWLIDFEWTRDGHTLFDWAMLETSLLIDHVCLSVGTEWDDVMQAINILDHINRKQALPEADQSPLADAFRPILEVRSIVHELLARENAWIEYHVALSLCALRVIGWKNRPLNARRLSFLASALAMSATRERNRPVTTTGGDLTDATTDEN